ncbi:TrmH family RNA methyltransferase [Paradesertivirga mongoliensis]|uniref:TrmH family RNA methyltransferase n=1 Tax=Paradesertivirga mongoliensis TaxID=2100740 RepID=A0ABW4ZMV3_9SPHI|nr:RNA methyltransferase [Pedobacter mongoliensis]
MLSKSQISFVNALHQKKHRKEHHLFIAEGSKSIVEFTQSSYCINTIFHTPDATPKLCNLSHKIKLHEITAAELKKISTLSTPQDALALIHIPERTITRPESFKGRFTLVLDGIQDPGNLGTIIRTADWFGFKDIICSFDTVDAYNPKVVQATMGSLSRINVYYEDLGAYFSEPNMPVYGALLDGDSVYETRFGKEGYIILGNEGNGISEKVQKRINTAITIPRFGEAESLNVAVSTAIICSELKRNTK